MNAATIIIVLVIAALVALAVRRVRRKGSCEECSDCRADDGCAQCGAVDKMVADMEKATKTH